MNQENKFYPFNDVGGPILITRLDGRHGKILHDRLIVIQNVTAKFEGKEVRGPDEGIGVMFDIGRRTGFTVMTIEDGIPTASQATLEIFKQSIERLWKGELDSFALSNIPGLAIEALHGPIPEEVDGDEPGAIQWDKEDLDRLVAIVENHFNQTKH